MWDWEAFGKVLSNHNVILSIFLERIIQNWSSWSQLTKLLLWRWSTERRGGDGSCNKRTIRACMALSKALDRGWIFKCRHMAYSQSVHFGFWGYYIQAHFAALLFLKSSWIEFLRSQQSVNKIQIESVPFVIRMEGLTGISDMFQNKSLILVGILSLAQFYPPFCFILLYLYATFLPMGNSRQPTVR